MRSEVCRGKRASRSRLTAAGGMPSLSLDVLVAWPVSRGVADSTCEGAAEVRACGAAIVGSYFLG